LIRFAVLCARMCEFCNDPTGTGNNRDQFHPSFAGFFSTLAIDEAVRQANANRLAAGDEAEDDDDGDADSDGT
jgi:hypothetical protein